MYRQTILAGLTLALGASALLLKLAAPAETPSDRAPRETMTPDPIVEQFQRELNREPGPVPSATGESIDNDELYRLVNAVHWTRDEEKRK